LNNHIKTSSSSKKFFNRAKFEFELQCEAQKNSKNLKIIENLKIRCNLINVQEQKILRISKTFAYALCAYIRCSDGEGVGGRRGGETGGRIIVRVVEISSHSLDGQRDGLRFKSYMRDVMSGKFRDVIH